MNDKDTRLREIIRVDHAGEYGAQQIYSGQIKFTKDTKFKSLLEHLADEEKEHFEYFEKLMIKKRVRPSLLQPVWRFGGFSLGAITAVLGRDFVMACTEAVESVIVDHYRDQLKELDKSKETELKKKISKFLSDEDEHKETGASNISNNTLKLRLFKLFVRKITQTAIKVSEKV